MTAKGGKRWESFATPNWNRYFQDGGWNGEAVEITAGSRERLIEIVNGAELLWGVAIDASGLEIEVLRPWDALPWKSLPTGFRATVTYLDLAFHPEARKDPVGDLNRRWHREVQLRTWATSICGSEFV